jgi:hypothetical protein
MEYAALGHFYTHLPKTLPMDPSLLCERVVTLRGEAWGFYQAAQGAVTCPVCAGKAKGKPLRALPEEEVERVRVRIGEGRPEW